MLKTGEAGKIALSSLFRWSSVKLHWKDRFPGGSYKEVLLRQKKRKKEKQTKEKRLLGENE